VSQNVDQLSAIGVDVLYFPFDVLLHFDIRAHQMRLLSKIEA